MHTVENANILFAHVYDLCVAHNVDGLQSAMVFGAKVAKMRNGDMLHVYGGKTLIATSCEYDMDASFELRVTKLSNKQQFRIERLY